VPSYGRIPNPPDDRDWSADKLHQKLGVDHKTPLPPPDDSLLDKTVREAIAEDNPFFTTWAGILALWRWIKKHLVPTPPSPTPTNVDGPLWEDLLLLDQGQFGTCVGNGGTGWLACAPVEDKGLNESYARQLYYDTTCEDGACDSTYQNGATVRSLAKVLQKRGKISAYAFANSIAEVSEWLHNHGPVVIGVDWYYGMEGTDAAGFVNLTGGVAGGHCVILRQDRGSQNASLGRNSWGAWGINDSGDFLIRDADLDKLLSASGDFLLAAEVAA